ncbi:MAG: CCA tRNA nucleotidyltransferase, partial [Sphingomonadales bacterium]|nr:CCA tRNA nucleotidyltransferase [Sphingomonadales bacterium]
MTRLPDAPWRHWDGLDTLLEALGAAEGRTRYVGGAVRDTLLGLEVQDLDLATALPPSDVVARIEGAGLKAVPTGLKHGTVTAVIGDKRPIEVTTLRRDISTDGRHAEIEYT